MEGQEGMWGVLLKGEKQGKRGRKGGRRELSSYGLVKLDDTRMRGREESESNSKGLRGEAGGKGSGKDKFSIRL